MRSVDRWSEVDLERALLEAGRAIDWPSGRDVAGVVQSRLVDRATSRTTGWSQLRESIPERTRLIRRSTILALAALLVLAAIAAAVGLGVPGIRIIFAPSATPAASVPAPTAPRPSTSVRPASPSPSPSVDASAAPIGLAEARARAGFDVLMPTDSRLGAIGPIGLTGSPPLARLSVAYGSGSMLTEFLGDVDPAAFTKIIGGDTTVEALSINGAPAYWISGSPHEAVIHYRLPDGTDRWETTTAGDVLIWTHGALTLRLETTLGRAAAIAIAASTR